MNHIVGVWPIGRLNRLMQVRLGAVLGGLLLWAACSNTLNAQDFDRYQPLQCEGPIPEELRTASSQKYSEQVAQLGDSARGRIGRVREEFLLQSNFVLDELLLSGRVLFNDPVTRYLTKVKNIVLRQHPELAKQVRIYVVKSPVVNAFATHSGTLLVNLGLLAHLQTEGELAFVLCHEIQHFIHKHPIKSYVQSDELRNNAKLLGINSRDALMAARAGYSRTLEFAADDLGFELYKSSGYSLDDAVSVFDVLALADRPFGGLPWDASFLEWEYLRFPAELTKSHVEPIVISQDEDDTLKTHPSTAKRRAAISAKIAGLEEMGEKFIVGEDQFLQARKRARFELSELYLETHEYEASIYNSYLLLQEEPQSHYLRKCMAQAMYGLCIDLDAGTEYGLVDLEDPTRGHVEQVAYFSKALSSDGESSDGFGVLALHEIWKVYLQDQKDPQLKAIAEDMMKHFFRFHGSVPEWLESEKPSAFPEILAKIEAEKHSMRENGMQEIDDSVSTDIDPPSVTVDSLGSKRVALLKPEEKRKSTYKVEDYMKWAVTDLRESPVFVQAWTLFDSLAQLGFQTTSDNRRNKLNGRSLRYGGMGLEIDKMVIVQPTYKEVDIRNKVPVQYLDSEKALKSYRRSLKKSAEHNDIDVTFVDNRNLAENAVAEFNDAATLQRWIDNYLNDEDRVKRIYFDQSKVQDIMERYGTKYVAWNGLITVTDRRDKRYWAFSVIWGVAFFPALPFVIAKMIQPNKHTVFVTLIFDLEASELLVEDYRLLKARDKQSITRAILYDIFMQIKQ